MNHEQKDIAYHDVIASEYDSVVISPRKAVLERALSEVVRRVPEGDTLIDLGCGTGHATLLLGHLFKSVIAVDHSESMLAEARRNFSARGYHHAKIVQQDAYDFLNQRDSASVDAVACIGFLHHLQPEGIASIISEVARLLKPQGTFVLSEPRVVDSNSVPKVIQDWNASAVGALGAKLQYSRETPIIPDEKHIAEEVVVSALAGAGLKISHISRHWEIFPHNLPVSAAEAEQIISMHEQFGSSGNCVTIIATK